MGFIGQYVIECLQANGHTPVTLDNRQHAHPCEAFFGDIRDDVAVTEAMAHVEGFIHLAAVLGTQETIQNPRPAAHTNIIGGLNILEGAAQYGIPGVYIGVGNHWMQNTYSITKTCVERFIAMYNKERGTGINIVRAVNAYGPRQLAAAPYGPGRVRKITPAFICRALANAPIEIYGDGEQVSDMVYVEDVAKALVLALAHTARGDVFDKAIEVGPDIHHTVNEVAELIIDLAESKSEIVHLPMRPGEIPGSTVVADTSTLAMIGMNAKVLIPVELGMTRTVKYFAQAG